MLWQVKMDPIFPLNPDMCQLELGLVPVKTTGLFFHLDCDHYPGFQMHLLGPIACKYFACLHVAGKLPAIHIEYTRAANAIYTFTSTCYKYYFWNLMFSPRWKMLCGLPLFSSARSFGFTRQKCIDVKYLHDVWDTRMVRDLAERSLCSLFLLQSWKQFFGGFLGSLCTFFWRSRAYSCICLGFMGWQCHKDLLVKETTGCSTVEWKQFNQNSLICPE